MQYHGLEYGNKHFVGVSYFSISALVIYNHTERCHPRRLLISFSESREPPAHD